MQIYQIVLLAVIGILTLSCIYLFCKLRELTFLFISIWGPIAAAALIFQNSSFSQPLSIIQSVLTVAICLFFIYQRIFKPKKASNNQNADQSADKQEKTSFEEPLDSNEYTNNSDAEEQEPATSSEDQQGSELLESTEIGGIKQNVDNELEVPNASGETDLQEPSVNDEVKQEVDTEHLRSAESDDIQ